jgi:hypothetical protein
VRSQLVVDHAAHLGKDARRFRMPLRVDPEPVR